MPLYKIWTKICSAEGIWACWPGVAGKWWAASTLGDIREVQTLVESKWMWIPKMWSTSGPVYIEYVT